MSSSVFCNEVEDTLSDWLGETILEEVGKDERGSEDTTRDEETPDDTGAEALTEVVVPSWLLAQPESRRLKSSKLLSS